ncbi:MAG: hypothetical protein AABY26_03890 [Nanoarchaeota archaeon]
MVKSKINSTCGSPNLKRNSAFETKVDAHKVWLGVGILVAVLLFAVFYSAFVSEGER